MDADAAARRLGLDDQTRDWLARAAEAGPPETGAGIPPASGARRALAPLGLQPADEDELAALWPDASWPEELLWVVGAMYARLAGDLTRGCTDRPEWPVLVHAEDARLRCAPIVALAAAAPLVQAAHARSGVPAPVTAATLADTGRHVAQTRAMFGRSGLETATWTALHFRCGLYELGRLQYEPSRVHADGAARWYTRERAAALGPEFAYGAPLLRIHIPAEGPLDAAGVAESLARARTFFRTHFGADYPLAACSSWLLDPQLAQYVPDASNILAFQRLFTPVDGGAYAPGDADVFRFVFGMAEVDTGRAPQRTRLERAVVQHLDDGRHWRAPTGWLRLD
ncbi:acyltransferase domain-containing protein [Streptomonospora salina]|uniref:Acyltransferase n=1 Tax=Streptomonospora salina TaxID=104205 RepID=A0A841E542_9ACTN|nr:acyltransferase domain-containing protein [Streptomonospora salina]MBB5996318.1 hypothetical protein [Streptomonospora salina]